VTSVRGVAIVAHGGQQASTAPTTAVQPAVLRMVPVAAAIGRALFTDYLFPFEVTSVLLIVALVGVIALAKRRTA